MPGLRPAQDSNADATRKRRTASDLVLVLLVVIVAFTLGFGFDLYERFDASASKLEGWEIDEIPVALLALALSAAWFAYRRAAEIRAEVTERERAEEALRLANEELRERAAELRSVNALLQGDLSVLKKRAD